jgi:hypothetical protein
MSIPGIVELIDCMVYDTVRGKPGEEKVHLFVEPFSKSKPLSETNMHEGGMFAYNAMVLHRLHCAFLAYGDVLATWSWPEGATLRFSINNRIYVEGSCWMFAHPLSVLKSVLLTRDTNKNKNITPRDFLRDGLPDWEKLKLLADVYNRPMDLGCHVELRQQEPFEVEIIIPNGWPRDRYIKVMVILEARPFLRPIQ